MLINTSSKQQKWKVLKGRSNTNLLGLEDLVGFLYYLHHTIQSCGSEKRYFRDLAGFGNLLGLILYSTPYQITSRLWKITRSDYKQKLYLSAYS